MELDSGASISVVPEELVPQALVTGKTVPVVAFDGPKIYLPTALTTISFDPHCWLGEVALLPSSQLKGRGLFAF